MLLNTVEENMRLEASGWFQNELDHGGGGMMEEKKREGEKAKRIKRACGARREHSQNGWFIKDEREELGEGKLSPAPRLERLGVGGGVRSAGRSHRYRVRLSMGFFET